MPPRTNTNEKIFAIVIVSKRNIPANTTPNTDVVEYSSTVLTAPIDLNPIKKHIVDIPVPNIEIIKIPGNCIKSTSKEI